LLTPFTAVRIGAQSARDPGVVGVTREQQQPLRPQQPHSNAEGVASFAEILDGSAALDALKPARDGDGFILRLHEIGGRESWVRLRLNWPVAARVTLCDILERPQEDHPMDGSELSVLLKPFGTATLRLRAV
jgi:alpha-mannosidase